ncbi:MAG: pilus assembly protein [Desulfosarcinaceae bacterium]|nr:pilus assembly protein [Desulfosarcinaceae bacterium]
MKNFFDFLRSIYRQEDGQSMVEFAICAPLLVLILYAIFYLSDLYILKSKVLVGARVAAWQVARGTHDAQAAETGVVDNFHFRFGGRDPRAHTSSLTDTVQGGSLELTMGTQQSSDFDLGGLNDLIVAGLGALLGDNSSSQTTVGSLAYQLPIQLGPLNLSDVTTEASFAITASHYVDGNSWNGCAVQVHDLLGAIRDSITGIFDIF